MTFAALTADFDELVREVDSFFAVLEASENGRLSVADGSDQNAIPPGAPPTEWGRMLKGTAYLVLYNLVEAFVRRGFQEVFDSIKGDNLSGSELSSLLVQQWIMQKNRKVKPFDGSPKVYMQIANELVREIVEKKAAALHRDRLPFSGNLDAEVIRDVCRAHGVLPDTEPLANGGASLVKIMKKRNLLAHGDESFSVCGGQTTITELLQAKEEVVLFMRSVLSNLAQFATTKSYKAII